MVAWRGKLSQEVSPQHLLIVRLMVALPDPQNL